MKTVQTLGVTFVDGVKTEIMFACGAVVFTWRHTGSCSLFCNHSLTVLWTRASSRRCGPAYTTQHDTTRHDTTRHDTTRHDTTRHDTTRHDTTRHDTTRHDTTRHDTTRHDTTQHNTLSLHVLQPAALAVEINSPAVPKYITFCHLPQPANRIQ